MYRANIFYEQPRPEQCMYNFVHSSCMWNSYSTINPTRAMSKRKNAQRWWYHGGFVCWILTEGGGERRQVVQVNQQARLGLLNYTVCKISDRTPLAGWQKGQQLSVGLLVVTIWLELYTSCSSICHRHLHQLNSGRWYSGTVFPELSWKMAVKRLFL